MALWGINDNKGTVPSPVTVVGTASSDFWTVSAGAAFTASGIGTGDSALLSAQGSGDVPGTEGFVTIEAFITPTLARVGKMSGVGTDLGPTGTVFDAAYCDQPISLKNDPAYAESAANTTTGISTIRTQVISGVSTAGIDAIAPGITTTVGGIHAGWVGIMTYVDMHGNLRTKTETFVAASGIQTGNRPFPAV